MKLKIAIDFFKGLLKETTHKSEVKIYETFIGIISDLENRNLDEDQLELIEEKLDILNLDLDPENRRRYYKGKLNEFKKYLRESFSLITEGYYTGIGLALGVAFGVAFGSMFGVGVGISIGMLFGVAIGASKDAEAKKQNRVINIKADSSFV